MATEKTYYCEKCNRTINGDQFYTSNNLEKYPNEGKFPMCKKCMTMHVDNWKPDTFLWILQEADVPYIPEEWNKLMVKYAKDPTKVTGMTIIGRYLGKMKLRQWADFRWKDSQFLQDLKNNEREQTMKENGYSAQEIAEATARAAIAIPETVEIPEIETVGHSGFDPGYDDPFDEPAADDPVIDLTDEDRIYLRLKWGKRYKPEEWVQLEQLYNEMMESYDIQTAGHIDTLKMLCKTSLKANQLIDIGDIDGYQKISKVYDALMKSGKFTAAQNKDEASNSVNAIGELVAICEKEGFIPRYYIDKPNDKVDQTILDMQRYTQTLIMEETNLGNLVEEALKNNLKEDEEDAQADDTDTGLVEEDVIGEIEDQLQYKDFEDYSEFLDNEEATDEDLLNFLASGRS